jgi:hypothetical protein
VRAAPPPFHLLPSVSIFCSFPPSPPPQTSLPLNPQPRVVLLFFPDVTTFSPEEQGPCVPVSGRSLCLRHLHLYCRLIHVHIAQSNPPPITIPALPPLGLVSVLICINRLVLPLSIVSLSLRSLFQHMPPNNPYATNNEHYARTLQAEFGAHSPQPQSQRPPTLGLSATHPASTSAQGLVSPMRLAASLRKLGGGNRIPASPTISGTQAYSIPPPHAPNSQHSVPSSDEEFARFLQAEEDAAFRTYDRQAVLPAAAPSSPAVLRSLARNLIPPQPEIPPPGFGMKKKAPANLNHFVTPPAYGFGTSSHSSGIAPMMHLSTVRLLRCSAYNSMTTRYWRECCRNSLNKNCLQIPAA